MHIVHGLRAGGMEYGVLKLSAGMCQDRFDMSVCSTVPSQLAASQVSPGVRVFELNRRPGLDLKCIRDLSRLMRRESPLIVHTHGWGTLVEGFVAARWAGVPCVVHGEHGTLQDRPYQRVIQRWVWPRTTELVSVSSKLAERMADVVGVSPSRIAVLRNGVDLDRFARVGRSQARGHLGVQATDFVIGTVGRLSEVKDHATLVEAAWRLKEAGVPATTVIVGEGPCREALEAEVARRGLGGSVWLLGHVSEVEALLPGFDVFVLSSRSEGLPNSVLEAMASGVPVVSTRVGGVEELVVEDVTGVLVEAGSAPALASALERLARDADARCDMGRAGRERAAREFALPVAVSRYEALYTRVAASAS